MRTRTEFQQIAELFAPLTLSDPAALSLKDDAAVLVPPVGQELVVTVDAIVEGVHYLSSDPPDLIARKLLRVNLSDVAAMGACPAGVFLSCAFPESWTDQDCEAFTQGLAEDVAFWQSPVLGGDTVRTSGPAVFSLTALGWCPRGQAWRRSGARSGDILAVTGTLGDGALGLEAAQGGWSKASAAARAFLDRRYHLPEPRLALAASPLRALVRGAMDVSDGLVQDLGHLCAASGVAATFDCQSVPLSAAAAEVKALYDLSWSQMLSGGDDYELLLVIAPEDWPQVQAFGGITAIGVFTEGQGVSVLDGGVLIPWERAGWQHF